MMATMLHPKGEETRETRYMPIVTVTHDAEGKVIDVEVDWSDSLAAIEQPLEEAEAESLALVFDEWVAEHKWQHWKA